jgi:hypothetical protein
LHILHCLDKLHLPHLFLLVLKQGWQGALVFSKLAQLIIEFFNLYRSEVETLVDNLYRVVLAFLEDAFQQLIGGVSDFFVFVGKAWLDTLEQLLQVDILDNLLIF